MPGRPIVSTRKGVILSAYEFSFYHSRADAHEPLGQLIAQARQHGVVPPWTVQKEKKKGNG